MNPPSIAGPFIICINGPLNDANDPAVEQCHNVSVNTNPGNNDTTFTGLLPGSYDIYEKAPIPAGWAVSPTAPITKIVPPNGQPEVKPVLVNTFHPGSLAVTKSVNFNGALAEEAPAGSFQLCIQGPSYSSPDCQSVAGGNIATWTGLLPGNYTVSETGQSSQWTVTVNGDAANNPVVNVSIGEPATATVVNTLKRGDLTIAKAFDWQLVPPGFQPAVSFAICIQGPAPSANTQCQTVANATASVSWTGLVPGNYTVGEFLTSAATTTVDSLDAWEVSISPSATVHVSAAATGTPAAATVTNQYQRSQLQVTKTVVTNGQVVGSGETFEICIQLLNASNLPADGQSPICHTYAAGGGLFTFTGLIPGNYRVGEVNRTPSMPRISGVSREVARSSPLPPASAAPTRSSTPSLLAISTSPNRSTGTAPVRTASRSSTSASRDQPFPRPPIVSVWAPAPIPSR